MFDDFILEIQVDEIAAVLAWNDKFEDPRYQYEE